MSHQIGAGLLVLPCQTTEFTNCTRHEKDAQNIYMHVPEFHAWRCHGKGVIARIKPRKAKIGKSG